jgi:hypothetical protein
MHQDLSSNNFKNECSRFKAIFSFLKVAWICSNRPDQIGKALGHSTKVGAGNTLTSTPTLALLPGRRLPPLLPLLPPPLLLFPPIRPPLDLRLSKLHFWVEAAFGSFVTTSNPLQVQLPRLCPQPHPHQRRLQQCLRRRRRRKEHHRATSDPPPLDHRTPLFPRRRLHYLRRHRPPTGNVDWNTLLPRRLLPGAPTPPLVLMLL